MEACIGVGDGGVRVRREVEVEDGVAGGCMWMYVDAGGGVFFQPFCCLTLVIGCDSGIVTSSTFRLYSFSSISILSSIGLLLVISSVPSTFILLTKP